MKNYLKSFMNRETFWQFIRMGLVGGFNTVAFFIFFNIFRWWIDWSPFWSVTWAFALATFLSYLLNRRWTFRIKGGFGGTRETVTFYVVNLLAWAITAGMVVVAEAWFGPLDFVQSNLVLVLATGIVVIPKFAGYRDVVFRRSLAGNTERS